MADELSDGFTDSELTAAHPSSSQEVIVGDGVEFTYADDGTNTFTVDITETGVKVTFLVDRDFTSITNAQHSREHHRPHHGDRQ
jgi:predicted aspartyl protease